MDGGYLRRFIRKIFQEKLFNNKRRPTPSRKLYKELLQHNTEQRLIIQQRGEINNYILLKPFNKGASRRFLYRRMCSKSIEVPLIDRGLIGHLTTEIFAQLLEDLN